MKLAVLTDRTHFPHGINMTIRELFRRSPSETTLAALRDLLELQNARIRTLERSRRELELLVSRRQEDRDQLLEPTATAKL